MKSHLRAPQPRQTANRVIAMAMHRATATLTHVARRPQPGPARALGYERYGTSLPEAMPPASLPGGARAARVGYVVDHFPRASQGFVLQEILALESRGIDVQVFSLGMPDGRLDDTAFALARLQSPVCYFLADTEASNSAPNGTMFAPDGIAPELAGSGMTSRAAHWIARQVAARNMEHLHAHGEESTDVAREAGRLTGLGYSFTAHAQDLRDGAAASVREKVLEAQFAVTLSDFDRGRLIGICGRGAADKLHRIPMSVDPEECRFSETDTHESDSILTVGPLVEKSGFTDLIEAMRIMRDHGNVARLTILGEGDREFEETLRARIDRAQLTGSVQFIANASRRELAMLMRMHSVLALPWTADDGDRDVLSNLVLEAMAGGLPVLSTDVPSIRELIDDGLTGRIISARDPVGLAGALETFFGSPRLCKSFASNARTTVEVAFAAGRNVSHLASLFVHAVARHPLGA